MPFPSPVDHVLSMVERVPEELWREVHNIAQKVVTKSIQKKKKYKKAKWLSEEALHTKLRKEKRKAKRKIYPTECRFPENRKER